MLRKATVPLALLATATAVAACGGSSPTNTTSASRTSHGSSALKLAECMRTHGVPQFPDPSSNGLVGIQASSNGGVASINVNGHNVNVSESVLQKAMGECSKYQPHGPAISGSQLAQIKQGAVRMAECMRAHGVTNFSDPRVSAGPGGHGIQVQIGGGGGGGSSSSGAPKQVKQAPPAFQHAMNACQKYMRVGLKARTG